VRGKLSVTQRVVDRLRPGITSAGHTDNPRQALQHLESLIVLGRDGYTYLVNTRIRQQCLNRMPKHGFAGKQAILLGDVGVVCSECARSNPCCRHKGNQAILAF
jgi:hypothetical protein